MTLSKAQQRVVDSVIEKYNCERGSLISILQDLQNEYNYLPQEVLTQVARELEIPIVHAYGVATFFRSFSLEPRGRHLATVCMGTACHVRGAPRILEEIERRLKVMPGETSSNREFTLETVNCLGCCAIGPIVVVDGEYHGEMNTRKVAPLLKRYDRKGNGKAKGGKDKEP